MSMAASGSIRVEAPAKINLYLHVVGRRANGYHELESLIAFTNEFDVLTMTPADELGLEIEGTFSARLSSEEDNLVLRAARALGEARRRRERARRSARRLGRDGERCRDVGLRLVRDGRVRLLGRVRLRRLDVGGERGRRRLPQGGRRHLVAELRDLGRLAPRGARRRRRPTRSSSSRATA